MARKSINISQQYPRVSDPHRADRNCLDDSALVPHENKIPVDKLKKFIMEAIRDAEKKSAREALGVSADATEKELETFYRKQGKSLFDYWKKYVSDPAAVAHQVHGKNYRTVGVDLFRSRALQKSRKTSIGRFSCEDAIARLDDLMASKAPSGLSMEMLPPDAILDEFGQCCKQEALIDELGNFHHPFKLLDFFIA